MTALTARYSASPESAMEQDLARLRDAADSQAFLGLLDGIVRTTFTEDYWSITLPAELATSAARSPALYVYNAALNLLDARALFSKVKIAELLDPGLRPLKSPVERHHLFPKAYLERSGIAERRLTNQIANFAWLEWADNIDVRDTPPKDYVPKLSRRFGQKEVEEFSYWHALPPGWEVMDYGDFLEARRPLIARVIRDGFETLTSSR